MSQDKRGSSTRNYPGKVVVFSNGKNRRFSGVRDLNLVAEYTLRRGSEERRRIYTGGQFWWVRRSLGLEAILIENGADSLEINTKYPGSRSTEHQNRAVGGRGIHMTRPTT